MIKLKNQSILISIIFLLGVSARATTLPAPIIDSSRTKAESQALSYERSGYTVSTVADNLDTLWDLVWGPDGTLYIATSSRDGRGNPRLEDAH